MFVAGRFSDCSTSPKVVDGIFLFTYGFGHIIWFTSAKISQKDRTIVMFEGVTRGNAYAFLVGGLVAMFYFPIGNG